jgi:methionyl-tRNA synthetase
LFARAAAESEAIADAYEQCDYARAMRLIMALADRANPYVESRQPWNLRKDPARRQELQNVCTVALNLFRQLAIYLSPVLPRLAEQTGKLLGDPIVRWDQAQTPLVGAAVAKFEHMLQRVDSQEVQKMMEESKETTETAIPASGDAQRSALETPPDSDAPLKAEPLSPEITIDDFAKIDLRVARIVAAEDVPEARKLLKLTLSLGGDDRRTVFAGIKGAYKAEDLVGRLVVMVANLAARQMKFGLSEGMVCASGAGGAEVYLLSPDSGSVPGERVH